MSARCELCFHHCELTEGQTGFCRARICRGGDVVPLNYGKLTSLAVDPIEKKPLRRFRPRSLILSVGSFGCNLRPEMQDRPPPPVERVYQLADEARTWLTYVYTGNC